MPSSRRRTSIAAALLVLLPAAAAAAERTGAELYASSCASCHGDDGSGRAQPDLGFATPVPEFTDCEFASREPDPDW